MLQCIPMLHDSPAALRAISRKGTLQSDRVAVRAHGAPFLSS